MNKFLKKIIKNFKSDKYLFFLCILSLVILVSVVRFALRTFKIPEWDEQHYMRMATEFYRLIKYNPSFNTPYEMLQVVPFRQIGYPLLILPFLLLFGLSKAYFWGIFTNGLLFVVSIFGIYFLAKEYLSKLSSFVASIIFAFYGWTQLHIYVTYSETAVSALTILTILFLIKSNYFQNKKYSFVFGLFLGLSLLVKWITAIFILGPAIFVLYKILKHRLFKKGIVIKNILFASILGLVVSIYPYYQNSYWIVQYFYEHRKEGPMWQMISEAERNPLSAYSLTYYLNTFNQLGIIFFLLILIGFILAFKKKSNLVPILLTVIVSYLFSSSALLKAERHIVPIFPYLAILSASAFDYIKNLQLKYLLFFLIIALSFFSFLGGTWGKGPMKTNLQDLPIELPFGQIKKIYLTTISKPPYIYKISGKEILEFIEKDSKKEGIVNPQVISLFYYRPLDEPLYAYNTFNLEKPLGMVNFLGTILEEDEKGYYYIIETSLKKSDYILVKTGQKTDDHFSQKNYKVLLSLIEVFEKEIDFSKNFELKAKFWVYQDSSEVMVFKNKKIVSNEELKRLSSKFSQIYKEKN